MKLRAVAAALAVCIPALAFGQGLQCDKRDVAVQKLGDKGETRHGAGLLPQGILEVYANEESGSFTIILTNVHGIACVIASGGEWREPIPEPEGVRL